MTDIVRDLQTSSAAAAESDETASPQADRDYQDFAVGDYVHFAKRFSQEDFAAFAQLSGDQNLLHHDAGYARVNGFAAPVVPLQLAAAPLSAIAGMFLPGRRSLALSSQLRGLQPIEYDSPIEYSARIISKHDAQRTLALQVIAFHRATVLLEGRMHVCVRDDAATESREITCDAVRGNAFDERAALVTGAAGDIGRAVSRALGRRGWKVILQGRDPERLERVAQECRRDGAEASTLLGDLSRVDERRAMIQKLADLPTTSALVHAASPRIDATLAELVEVNYAALRDLAESLLGGMLARQHGRVVLIGSAAVDHPQPGWEDYAAAKQAAAGYVRAFDGRYSAYGLCGLVAEPGFVLGDFSQAWRPDGVECLLPEETAEAIVEELEAADRRQGGCLRLAPGSKRRGRFGFHPSCGERESGCEVSLGGDSQAADLRGAGVPHAERQAKRGPRPADWDAPIALGDEVRRFFRLADDASLAEAGLGATPGWDSLGHLELLMHLESTLGVSFTSGELSRTTRYADLQSLLNAKRSQV